MRLHDRSGRLLRTWSRLPAAVQGIAVADDGVVLAAAADGTVWQLASDRAELAIVAQVGEPVYALTRHRGEWIVGVQDRWQVLAVQTCTALICR